MHRHVWVLFLFYMKMTHTIFRVTNKITHIQRTKTWTNGTKKFIVRNTGHLVHGRHGVIARKSWTSWSTSKFRNGTYRLQTATNKKNELSLPYWWALFVCLLTRYSKCEPYVLWIYIFKEDKKYVISINIYGMFGYWNFERLRLILVEYENDDCTFCAQVSFMLVGFVGLICTGTIIYKTRIHNHCLQYLFLRQMWMLGFKYSYILNST